MKKTSYLRYSWDNFYVVLFLAALSFTIGLLIEAEGLNKLFAITPILSMIALVWGSRKSYSIYLSYITKL
jgi:hypothetical protein